MDSLRRPETADTNMLASWNWQAATLVLAAFACLLFFLVAACVFWQHYRYWKKMERMERGYNAGKLNCCADHSSEFNSRNGLNAVCLRLHVDSVAI